MRLEAKPGKPIKRSVLFMGENFGGKEGGLLNAQPAKPKVMLGGLAKGDKLKEEKKVTFLNLPPLEEEEQRKREHLGKKLMKDLPMKEVVLEKASNVAEGISSVVD